MHSVNLFPKITQFLLPLGLFCTCIAVCMYVYSLECACNKTCMYIHAYFYSVFACSNVCLRKYVLFFKNLNMGCDSIMMMSS